MNTINRKHVAIETSAPATSIGFSMTSLLRGATISLATLLVALGGSVGCSGEEPGTSENPAPVTEQQLVEELARAYCAAGTLCCNAGGLDQNTDCVQTQQEHYADWLLGLRKNSDEAAVFDAEGAFACLDSFLDAKGSCTEDIDNKLLARCTGIYQVPPSKGLGESCMGDSECIPPAQGVASCRTFGTTDEKTCQHTLTVLDGEACGEIEASRVTHLCGQDFGCDPEKQVCKPLPGLDEPCLLGSCRDGFVCTQGHERYVCRKDVVKRDEGRLCTVDEQCVRGHCDAKHGVCRAPRGRAAGETCAFNVDCISGRCNYVVQESRKACDVLAPLSSPMVNDTTCRIEAVTGIQVELFQQ